MAAVPLQSYQSRERRLAQFGREFVYTHAASKGRGGQSASWQRQREATAAAAAAANMASGSAAGSLDLPAGEGLSASLDSDSEAAVAAGQLAKPQRQWAPIQPWIRDALNFVAAYPRVADPYLIRRANVQVQRSTLPLRPYMQPPRQHRQTDGSVARPSALLARCQLMVFGRAAAVEPRTQQPLQQRSGHGMRRSYTQQPLQQRSQLHALCAGSRSSGAAGRAATLRAQFSAAAVRTTLLQAGTRMLRMLRAF